MKRSGLAARQAFEKHAEDYDQSFSNGPLAQDLRERTWRFMDAYFKPGHRVLDLGCGTGEDALHLARLGVHVQAVDFASSMLDRVREKANAEGLGDRIELRTQDCRDLALPPGCFDGLICNFGVLNCLPDLDWLKPLAQKALKPESPAVIVMMGRFYPLELAANLLTGRWGTAFRRFQKNPTASVGGTEFEVAYHSLSALAAAFGTTMRLERTMALSLFLPVPGLEHIQERFGPVFAALRPVDRYLSRTWPLSASGDHFVSVWRRS